MKDAEHFYQQIAARKLDYQKNEYNMKRLEDFIRIYALAKQKSGEMPLLIIKIAAHNNLKLPEVKERTQDWMR